MDGAGRVLSTVAGRQERSNNLEGEVNPKSNLFAFATYLFSLFIKAAVYLPD